MNKIIVIILLPFLSIGQEKYELDTIRGAFYLEIGPKVISYEGSDTGIPRETVLIHANRRKISKNYKYGVYHLIELFSSLNNLELQKVLQQNSNLDYKIERDILESYSSKLLEKEKYFRSNGYYYQKVEVEMVIVKLKRRNYFIANELLNKRNKRNFFKEINVSNFLVINIINLK